MSTDLDTTCVACGRLIDMAAGEALHYPCSWGCSGRIRTLREEHPDRPTCIDCLPDIFKGRFLGGGRPILSAADLPRVGDPIPDHVVCKKDPR